MASDMPAGPKQETAPQAVCGGLDCDRNEFDTGLSTLQITKNAQGFRGIPQDPTLEPTPAPTPESTEVKNVTCRFQLLVDEHEIGQVKPTEDGLEYALCRTDEMQIYYLLLDNATKDLLPGDKVALTLEEVTHQSTVEGTKPSLETQNMPLYKVLRARPSENLNLAASRRNNQIKEFIVLTILCKYNDHAPDYTSERQAELDLFATPSDMGAGSFRGSMAHMTKIATYGKVILPRSKAKTVTVQMGSNWGSVSNCPIFDIAKQALRKLREQHPSINPDKFTTREFFIPSTPSQGCQAWAGRADLGCGHPSILPNLGGCDAWYRAPGSFVRAHELGHNLGLMHAGGESGGQGSTMVEYGDRSAAMGASFRFSSFIASSRFFLGVLGNGMVDRSNGAAKPLTLGSISLPLGQTGADAIAIRMHCPRCVPKVSQHANNKGGYIWVSFRGDEGYSAIQNGGLEERFQNKVYVHLARKFSNPRASTGSELWKVLQVGEAYRPDNLQHTIYVCSIVEDLAKIAVGSSVADASTKCGGTLQPVAIRWSTHPDKCLDIAGGRNKDGTNVQLWDCPKGTHENMQFLIPPTGVGRIQWAKHPTKCLDVRRGETNNGANLQIWSCTTSDENPNMQFVFPSVQGPIVWATHKSKCVDVGGGRTRTGTNIQMWDCHDGGNQQFIKIGTEIRFKPKNVPGYFLRHRSGEAWLDKADNSNVFRMDSSFIVRSGLAGSGSISFESKNFPNHFLRHLHRNILLHKYDGSSLFRKDASFYVRSPLFHSSGFNSYESYNLPNHYLRHMGFRLRVDKLAGGVFRQDATWKLE